VTAAGSPAFGVAEFFGAPDRREQHRRSRVDRAHVVTNTSLRRSIRRVARSVSSLSSSYARKASYVCEQCSEIGGNNRRKSLERRPGFRGECVAHALNAARLVLPPATLGIRESDLECQQDSDSRALECIIRRPRVSSAAGFSRALRVVHADVRAIYRRLGCVFHPATGLLSVPVTIANEHAPAPPGGALQLFGANQRAATHLRSSR